MAFLVASLQRLQDLPFIAWQTSVTAQGTSTWTLLELQRSFRAACLGAEHSARGRGPHFRDACAIRGQALGFLLPCAVPSAGAELPRIAALAWVAKKDWVGI